ALLNITFGLSPLDPQSILIHISVNFLAHLGKNGFFTSSFNLQDIFSFLPQLRLAGTGLLGPIWTHMESQPHSSGSNGAETPEAPFSKPEEHIHKPTLIVFPFSGFQFPGMGKDLYENNPIAQDVYTRVNEAARKILGDPHFDVRKISFEGTKEDFLKEEN